MTLPAPSANVAAERVRIFGGVLQSDRPLPGLPVDPPAVDGQIPFWTLTTADVDAAPAHSVGTTVSGSLAYSSGPIVTLARRGPVTELVVSDTGRFDIDGADHCIRHLAPRQVDRAAVALDLIGVVLPTALHGEGAWCLHASAVATPAGVIAFVAQPGTGKSTLAAACVHVGCALVADDVVVLRANAGGVTVTPTGVPLRLRESTARSVGVSSDDADGWGKVRVAAAMAVAGLPLAAVYLLSAAPAVDDCVRAVRAARAAALALLTNGKITPLLGGMEAGVALERCIALAARVPVYDLAVPRDLSRLPEVVQSLLAWHPRSPTASTPA